jgi:hypothetical protein
MCYQLALSNIEIQAHAVSCLNYLSHISGDHLLAIAQRDVIEKAES